jgi:hypothetical protein
VLQLRPDFDVVVRRHRILQRKLLQSSLQRILQLPRYQYYQVDGY